MITASMAVLDIAAKRRSEWLYDIYQMGRDAIRAGADEAYVIPTDQWDAGVAAKLVNVLRWGAIEVERARAPVTLADRAYAADSYIVRGGQSFRPYLTDLLNPQVYPERRLSPGGPPKRPYDITGWTLPLQMGVTVHKIEEPGIGTREALTREQQSSVEPVEWASPRVGHEAGHTGFAYVLDPRSNDTATAINRLLQAGATVYRTTMPLSTSGHDWPAGTFLVTVASTTHSRIEAEATARGLSIVTIETPPDGESWQLTMPRIGVYHGWGGNADEGWTRWVLEQFAFPYSSVYDEDLRSGNLGGRYDVIVLPDAGYERMLHGLRSGTMPPEYTGGMTLAGVANLQAFTEAGGTLVAMDSAAELPLKMFDLPVTDVTERQSETDLFVPGSILQILVDPSHPVAYGMPERAAAFFARSPAFSISRARSALEQATSTAPISPEAVTVVAEYPSSDILMSGWLLGERALANRAAVVHAHVGRGQLVLLGFRTQHRGQPHGTFKLLFNSLYLGGMRRVAVR